MIPNRMVDDAYDAFSRSIGSRKEMRAALEEAGVSEAIGALKLFADQIRSDLPAESTCKVLVPHLLLLRARAVLERLGVKL